MTRRKTIDRRNVLRSGLTLMGGAAMLPVARAAGGAGPAGWRPSHAGAKRLVLIELFGGNDGLETVIPFDEDEYHRNRPTTRISKKEVLPIDDYRGFHPAMPNLRGLYDDGRMAIVEGCGYPVPVLSHFKSFEIWHTCREVGRASGDGWVGRLRAAAWGDDDRTETVVHVGSHLPYSLHSTDHAMLAFETPESYLFIGNERDESAYAEAARRGMDAKESGADRVLERLRRKLRDAQATSPRVIAAARGYEPRVEYPKDELGNSMRVVASMIDAGFDTRVFSVSLGNFDTHGPAQKVKHRELLASWDGAVSAFLADIAGTEAENDTLVLAYSEFGRRVAENASNGTDHGAAGPMFLFGKPVEGGLYGAHPSLTDLDGDGNLRHNTDFRSVIATVVEDWFGVEQTAVLPREYAKLSLVHKA
ncbi:MAG: DUF1501 domain-containing protein [Planctomycetota bacterium]|jgi:uncharacterized protein (DUF1501 family)|nr:DUF1501 domain-containing protein [Planctomycetota bacterium]